ncbi:MAG: hypothetical protein R3F37_23315 [Candidatus Competibacteraceae bacterium]
MSCISRNDDLTEAFRIDALSLTALVEPVHGTPAQATAPVQSATAPTDHDDVNSPAPPPESTLKSLRKELFLAFLGGLILNFMPCVFPVLSIKALSLIDKSRKAPWEVRRHGMVFTAAC